MCKYVKVLLETELILYLLSLHQYTPFLGHNLDGEDANLSDMQDKNARQKILHYEWTEGKLES